MDLRKPMSLLLVAMLQLFLWFPVSRGVTVTPTGRPGKLSWAGATALMTAASSLIGSIPLPGNSLFYTGQLLASGTYDIEGVSVSIKVWVLNTITCSIDPLWSLPVSVARMNELVGPLMTVLEEQISTQRFADITGTYGELQIQFVEASGWTSSISSSGEPRASIPALAQPHDAVYDCHPSYNTLFSKVDYGEKYEDGTFIYTDNHLRSANGLFTLIMQSDCNLVLYNGKGPTWSTDSWGKGTHCYAVLHNNGILAVYKRENGRPVWQADVKVEDADPEATYAASLQNDGNFVTYKYAPFSNGVAHVKAIWASGTNV